MARVNNFQRDIKLLLDRTLSREAQQKMIATAARGILKDAQEQNARVLGQTPPHEHWVDGREGAPFESINPDGGNITVQFRLVNEVVDWIYAQLVQASPALKGVYRRSHRLFADGVEVDAPDPTLQAKKWEIVSNTLYSRKIERGQSDQAPDGVYEVTVALARQRFGNVAEIKFTWVSVSEVPSTRSTKGGKRADGKATRYPAIKIWTR